MSGISFPGPGQDGEQPPPGGPARDEDDFDMDAEMARFLADVEAGREVIPEPGEDVPACTVSLGEAVDVDPGELAGMCGPDGLGGEVFARDRAADVMRPGPVLAALTERAGEDLARLGDDELLGAISAARRLRARADYLELAATAEFARRRAGQFEAAKARKVPRGCREGEFADSELAMELVVTGAAASDQMELAADLTTRLPATFAGLAAGVIDRDRAAVIWHYTRFLADEHAAQADEILAAAAPAVRTDLLARRAARLEMKLDPEGTRRRKDEARNHDQRVEARREASGNASFAGRELPVEDAMAAKAQNDADAAALRAAGMEGSLRQLRVLAYLDRLKGRNPMDRISGPRGARSAPDNGHGDGRPHGHDDPHDEGCPDDEDYRDGEDDGDYPDGGDGSGGDSGGPGSGPRGTRTAPGGAPAPFPALITLTVPAGTLLGWSTTPGEAGTWGLTDADDTRRIVQAASQHPTTRWCVTVTGPDGTAIAHGCARGPHPWTPEPGGPGPDQHPPGGGGGGRDGPGSPRDGTPPPGPDEHQAAQLAGLLRALHITLAPIAKGSCDHRHREDRYTPSRKLKHLVRARTATCSAPGCGAQAIHCDLDHSIPYPDGITCECDLAPKCRRHHRCKQAPGWKLQQPEPGLIRWTGPSGRTYTTTPTVYES
jgi:Domain of unknown function (DUF222)